MPSVRRRSTGFIPQCASALVSDSVETAPAQHDRHIQMIKERGQPGWQRVELLLNA